MRFMNYWDIQRASDQYCAPSGYQAHPILGPACLTLQNLVGWTNLNSDGWAYWPKPVRAAAKLMELIERPPNAAGYRDITLEEYKAALKPVKAFRTRHKADFEIHEACAKVEA